MPGAVLLLLDRGANGGARKLGGYRIHGGAHLVAAVADDRDDELRVDASRGVEGVRKQTPAADGVQGLLFIGLHPGAGASGEDHNGAGRRATHE